MWRDFDGFAKLPQEKHRPYADTLGFLPEVDAVAELQKHAGQVVEQPPASLLSFQENFAWSIKLQGAARLEQAPRHVRIKGLELPRQSSKESSSRSLLGCENANSGAATNLIALVRDVDDIEVRRERTGAREFKGMAHTQIDLVIARGMIAVGNDIAIGVRQILAQSRPEQVVDTKAGSQPQIRYAARRGHPALVIEVDVVARDVIELLLGEVELRRFHALPMRGLPRAVEVVREVVDRW